MSTTKTTNISIDPIINLRDLKATRAAMTPGPWVPGADRILGDPNHEDGAVHIATMEVESMAADRDGIVATHNAADVLIEIAWTALALSEAGEAFAQCRWPRGSEMRRRLELAAIEAERAHLIVLSRVTRRPSARPPGDPAAPPVIP